MPLTVVGRTLEPGEPAPAFTLDRFDGSAVRFVSLRKLAGSVVVLNVVNSVDTPVCDVQTRRVDSLFAGATLLTRSEDFGRGYGVLIKEWRELQRSVFVIDQEGRLAHAQYVADQDDQPDYDAAVAAVTRLAG